jgi:hypothetical protein
MLVNAPVDEYGSRFQMAPNSVGARWDKQTLARLIAG